ncbi:spinster family MFS transporter [Candidatus Seongchinamella marina]|jgi:predicted MFS family arabinose efflux permease|nr:MFS transporter [Candidatus Seongchinamella marina]
MSVTSAVSSDKKVSSKVAGYGLFMLTLVYAFNFVDRQILVILQEPIKNDMGLSDTQLGLLSGFSFALVYITAGIPIAYWADRTNRRNIITASLAVWSGMTALSGLAQNYSQLLLARIGVGIGEAGGSPPAHSMISDYYPPERRATAMAIYTTGLHLGILMGFIVGGLISEFFGWRIAFFSVGIPGVLLAVVFYFTVKEPPRGQWDESVNMAHKPSLGETLKHLSSVRSFWYLALAAGATSFAGYGNGNFAPSFLIRNHGFSVGEVGVVLAIFGGGGGMIGTFLGGYLTDRLGVRDRRWYVWLPALAGIIALPMGFPYLLLDNTTVVIGLMFFVTLFLNTYMGPVVATCHALVPSSMRAMASAILFFVLNMIGLGLGPLTVGVLSDLYMPHFGNDGLRYAMLTVGLLSSIGIVLFYLAGRHLEADVKKAQAVGQGDS